MLFPLTLALGIIVIVGFVLFTFRVPLAHWLGSTKRTAADASREVTAAFKEGEHPPYV